MLSQSNRRRHNEQQAASVATRREHDDLLLAIHRLEAALGSPAPSRETQWKARVARDLVDVKAKLEAHVLSAEQSTGLFSELELVSPLCAIRVAKLRADHSELLELVRDLTRCFAEDAKHPDFADLRRKAGSFLSKLRQHHAEEVDLIYESFWTDIGVGD